MLPFSLSATLEFTTNIVKNDLQCLAGGMQSCAHCCSR